MIDGDKAGGGSLRRGFVMREKEETEAQANNDDQSSHRFASAYGFRNSVFRHRHRIFHQLKISRGYFARPLYPSVSIATWYTAPRATIYSVFLPGPAKAKLLGFRDTGMVPRCLPCGLKTWMPAAVAAYTRSWPSIARPSPPNLTSGVPFASGSRFHTWRSCADSSQSRRARRRRPRCAHRLPWEGRQWRASFWRLCSAWPHRGSFHLDSV